MFEIILLCVVIAIIAFLYAAVGHGGASGYIAVMALFGILPMVMKPTALSLNILVASLGTIQFYKANFFSWKIFLPLIVTSIPCAYIGGAIQLPQQIYKQIIGIVLLYSAYQLFFIKKNKINQPESDIKAMPLYISLIVGAVIGFASGMTGVGGGIFLSPLLILMNWASVRNTAGISAAFILVNSIAGLLGHISSVQNLPEFIPYLAIAALIGGSVGAYMGSRQFAPLTIRKLLSFTLLIAALKLIFV